jgi:hypothetical protein
MPENSPSVDPTSSDYRGPVVHSGSTTVCDFMTTRHCEYWRCCTFVVWINLPQLHSVSNEASTKIHFQPFFKKQSTVPSSDLLTGNIWCTVVFVADLTPADDVNG